MIEEKINPPEVDSVGAETSEGFDEIERLPDRLQNYSEAKDRACQIIAGSSYLLSSYQGPVLRRIEKALEAMTGCGNYLLFKQYFTVGKTRLANGFFCKKSLLCPLCALRRSAKALGAVERSFSSLRASHPHLKASLVTFTVKNRKDAQACKDHIFDSFKRIGERRRNSNKGRVESEFAKMEGGVFSFEIKRGKGSKKWHVHIHGVILHEQDFVMEWNQDENQMVPGELRREWFKITGDSFHVHLRPFYNQDEPMKDLCEVTSYAMKFSNMSIRDLLEAYTVFSGSRLLRTYGLFYGLKVPTEMNDDLFKDLPYIEILYRYSKGKGYDLLHAKHKQQKKHDFEDPNLRAVQNQNFNKRGDMLPDWQYDEDLISSINQAPF